MLTSNFDSDDRIRGRALGVAIDPSPQPATDREKLVAALEENAALRDQLREANDDLDTTRAERNLVLWGAVVLLLATCWLAGQVMALRGVGE